jgi:hypothetical protein
LEPWPFFLPLFTNVLEEEFSEVHMLNPADRGHAGCASSAGGKIFEVEL